MGWLLYSFFDMLRPNTAQKGDELASVTCNRTSVLAATPNDTGHGKRRIDDGWMSNERDGVRQVGQEERRLWVLEGGVGDPNDSLGGRIERAVKMPTTTKRYM